MSSMEILTLAGTLFVPTWAEPFRLSLILIKKLKDNIKSFNKQAVNVADLLNLNFNCAYGVGKKRSNKFKGFCGHAVELLRNNYMFTKYLRAPKYFLLGFKAKTKKLFKIDRK